MTAAKKGPIVTVKQRATYDHAMTITALSWAKAEYLRLHGAPQLPLTEAS